MAGISNVEVRNSEIRGGGRGLFARKNFSPGDLVLSVDRPLMAEARSSRAEDTCAWCFQRGAKDPMERAYSAQMGLPTGFVEVKSCTGCRRIGYCGKACQSRAWKREHKYECHILAPQSRPDLPHYVRAVVKLLGRLRADPEGNKDLLEILKFPPAGKPPNDQLADFRRQRPQKFQDFEFLGNAAWQYTGRADLGNNLNSLEISTSFIFNIWSNAFDLSSPIDNTPLGHGFDPVICSANHSCDPNVVFVFNQPQTVIRALKPIKKGEELFLKYTSVTNPFGVRQADLKEDYLFTCQCVKCVKGPVFPTDTFLKPPSELSGPYCAMADKLIRRHKSSLSKYEVPSTDETAARRLAAMQAEAFSVAEDDEADIAEVKRALGMCFNSGMWSWTRQPVPELCRKLLQMHMNAGSIYKAFRVGCKLYFEIDPNVDLTGEAKTQQQKDDLRFYPDHLIDTWTMSTITNVLCGPTHQQIYDDFAKAGIELRVVYLRFLLDLYANMPKMYGLESPFGTVVKSTHEQVIAGLGLTEVQIREKVDKVWPALEAAGRSFDIVDDT